MVLVLWILETVAFHVIGCLVVTGFILLVGRIMVKGVKDGIEGKVSVLRGNVQQERDQDTHKMEA